MQQGGWIRSARNFLVVGAFAIPIQSALGTSYSWTGSGGDENWTNPLN
jgi:hypothetical protein